MHMSLDEVLWPNRYLLTIIGIWPLPPGSNIVSRLFAWLRIFIHFVSVSLLIIPLIYTIKLTWGNISILADCGSVMMIHILMVLKLTYVILRRRTFHRMQRYVKDFWEISDDVEERQSFEFFANLAKTITIVAYVFGLVDILVFVIFPAIDEIKYNLTANHTGIIRILPLDLLYGFDYQQSPKYEMLFILQIIGFFCSTTSVIGNDFIVMTYVLHFAGQFRLISTRLENIGKTIYQAKHQDSDGKFMIRKIGKCIEHHQYTIRVTEELSSLASPMVFAQIVSSGLGVCFGGFAIIKGNTSGIEFAKFCVLFSCIMLQLLVWCWPGEVLIQESSAIAETICSKMPWFMFPVNVRRDLKFVVLRAQKESQIVGFFQVMSVRKLTEVFNTAGSYIALLRSFQD